MSTRPHATGGTVRHATTQEPASIRDRFRTRLRDRRMLGRRHDHEPAAGPGARAGLGDAVSWITRAARRAVPPYLQYRWSVSLPLRVPRDHAGLGYRCHGRGRLGGGPDPELECDRLQPRQRDGPSWGLRTLAE